VTRAKSCRQTTHTKPRRQFFLEEPDFGFH